jgi:hypothetical protein
MARHIKDIDEFADMELLHRRRNKHGLGWGSAPLPNLAQDSLESRIYSMSTNVTLADANQKAANEEAAYWIAAMGELYAAAPLAKLSPKFNRDLWLPAAWQVRDGGVDLAKASAMSNAAEMKNAALKISNACNKCHDLYRN